MLHLPIPNSYLRVRYDLGVCLIPVRRDWDLNPDAQRAKLSRPTRSITSNTTLCNTKLCDPGNKNKQLNSFKKLSTLE